MEREAAWEAAQEGAELIAEHEPERAIEVLERLIDDELILQKATDLKLSVSSDQIDASIEEIKKQNNIDDDQLRDALRGQGMSMAAYRADLKRQLLRFRVLNIAVGSRVNVSDEEVKAYYERLQARPGYWHFERVHNVVLARQYDCGKCHAELGAFYDPATHHIDRAQQIRVCPICHSGEDRR